MPEKKYTQDDFYDMSLRVDAILDFVKLLDYYSGRDDDRPAFTSITLILKTLIEPLDDFLSWAYTSAEIPEEEPETATTVRGVTAPDISRSIP
jgi:hypothetical protein